MTSHGPDHSRADNAPGDVARHFEAVLQAHRANPRHTSTDIAAEIGLEPVVVADAIRELIAHRRLRAAAVYAPGAADPTYMNLTEVF